MSTLSLQETEEILAKLWTQQPDSAIRKKSKNIKSTNFDEGFHVAEEQYQIHVRSKRENFTASNYPLCCKLLNVNWGALVEQYWTTYPSNAKDIETALKEFPRFLRQNQEVTNEFPFAAELADFEQSKLLVMRINTVIPQRAPATLHPPGKHQNASYPILNPTLKLCSYEYPLVHIARKLSQRKQSSSKLKFEKLPTTLAIYQDPQTREVLVQNMGAVAAAILSDAGTHPTSFADLARNALFRLNDTRNAELHKLVIGVIDQLYSVGLFVGTENFPVGEAGDS